MRRCIRKKRVCGKIRTHAEEAAALGSALAPRTSLPLLGTRPRLALVADDRMQLDLDRVLRGVSAEALAPVVGHGVSEDVAVAGECGGGDGASDFRVALEAVLCVLVPEVEGAVGAGGAEGTVLRVERDGVDGKDFGDVALGGVLLAVAFEGEIEAGEVCQW